MISVDVDAETWEKEDRKEKVNHLVNTSDVVKRNRLSKHDFEVIENDERTTRKFYE